MLPKIFIACSVERLALAREIKQRLRYVAEGRVWDEDTMKPSSNPVDDLLAEIETVDFGVFIFGMEDKVEIRGEQLPVSRDNVLFEFGLALGRLGKERTFIVRPGGALKFRWATDLLGMNALDYDPNVSSLATAMGYVATPIENRIKEIFLPRPGIYLGSRREALGVGWESYGKDPGHFDAYDDELRITGGADTRYRYPTSDTLNTNATHVALRVRRATASTPVRLHLAVRDREGRSGLILITNSTSDQGWVLGKGKETPEYRFPLGHISPNVWHTLIIDLPSLALEPVLKPPVATVLGLRASESLNLTHLVCVEKLADLPELFRKGATVLGHSRDPNRPLLEILEPSPGTKVARESTARFRIKNSRTRIRTFVHPRAGGPWYAQPAAKPMSTDTWEGKAYFGNQNSKVGEEFDLAVLTIDRDLPSELPSLPEDAIRSPIITVERSN